MPLQCRLGQAAWPAGKNEHFVPAATGLRRSLFDFELKISEIKAF